MNWLSELLVECICMYNRIICNIEELFGMKEVSLTPPISYLLSVVLVRN